MLFFPYYSAESTQQENSTSLIGFSVWMLAKNNPLLVNMSVNTFLCKPVRLVYRKYFCINSTRRENSNRDIRLRNYGFADSETGYSMELKFQGWYCYAYSGLFDHHNQCWNCVLMLKQNQWFNSSGRQYKGLWHWVAIRQFSPRLEINFALLRIAT